MAYRKYADLDILIEPGPGFGEYEARIIASPAGVAGPVSVAFSLSDDRLALLLLQMDPGVVRTRRVSAPEARVAEELGGMLFAAVFRDALNVKLKECLAGSPSGLRIRLRLSQVPELARLPWELLYDEEYKFLAQSERTPIVRYLDVALPDVPYEITGPLRILTIISSPRTLPALDVEAEWQAVANELSDQVSAGNVVLDRLETPTLSALRRWLRSNEVHVIHFIGHGDFDVARDDGVLYFEDGVGNPHAVDPSLLGPVLRDHDPLRLVVLNACQSARSGGTDAFAGMAQGLVERAIPAVVAMQFPITDSAAVCFAGDFYSALATGQPVDQALSGARKALQDAHGSEWATPVIFLRSDSGDLFRIAKPPASPQDGSIQSREIGPTGKPPSGGGPAPDGGALSESSATAASVHQDPPRPEFRHRWRWVATAIVVAVMAAAVVSAWLVNRDPEITVLVDNPSPSVNDDVSISGQVRSVAAAGCPIELWRILPGALEWTHRSGRDSTIAGDGTYRLVATPLVSGNFSYQVRVPECNGGDALDSDPVLVVVAP